MQVVVRPHLLSTREQFVRHFSYGMTIAEIADSLAELDPNIRRHSLAVLINGETLPRDQWGERRLQLSDEKLEFAVVLQGGGGRGKAILGVIAMIALTAVTGGLAAAALGGMGIAAEGTALLIAKAGIMLVGSLLIHAIFAPPRTAANQDSGSVSPTYSFSGQSNQPRRFARLPRIYGRHRYVADVAALPYTMNVGDDVYLYAVYSFGYASLQLEDFRIGQNPLTNYSDYDIEIHENFTDSSQLVRYKSDVWQDSVSIEVKQATPAQVTTQDGAEKVILDISWTQGLMTVHNDGTQDFGTSDMVFEYRKLGDVNWLQMNIERGSHGLGSMTLKYYLSQRFYPGITTQVGPGEQATISGFPAGTNTFVGWAPIGSVPTAGTEMMVGPYHLIIQSVTPRDDIPMHYDGRDYAPYTTVTTAGLPGDLPLTGDQVYMYSGDTIGTGSDTNKLHFEEKKAQPFTVSVEYTFPQPGQYEIRVSKVEADYPDDETNVDPKHLWRRYVTAVRTMKSVAPLNPEVPITVVELVIKATGQLNGTIDQFSAIATSRLRFWNTATNLWDNGPTRNPAWVYLDILQGTANNRPIPDSRIDMDAIKAWAVRCDQIDAPFTGPMGTCDIVVDREYTVWELMQNVAATGRAAPTMKDNKYSILLDTADRIPVQMFTNRNSSGLKSTRTYQDEPHALRVQWIDALNNYVEAETIVYNTGHDANNTTVFEDLQSFGMTRAEQVLRWGRYMLAQAKLRKERFTITTDVEHIVCTRGDLVLVAHDVIEVGGDPSRIVDIQGGRFFLDAPPTRDIVSDPTVYGIRVRRSDGYITGVINVLDIGNDGEYDYIDVNGDITGITADNLVVFGPISEVVGEYVVDSITPGADLTATISLEELAPEVYSAEYNGLENLTYTPQGGGMLAPPVDDLVVTITVAYIGNAAMGTVRATWRPAQGMPYQPDDYRVWLISPTGNEEFQGITKQLAWELAPIDITLLNGYTFTFRVRPFYGIRGLGPAVETSLAVEYQPRLPPPLVDNFDVQSIGNLRRYLWSYNGSVPVHMVGIVVRYIAGSVATPTWDAGTDIITGEYIVGNGDEYTSPQGAGTFTLMARSKDDKGELSDGMFTVIREFAADTVVDLTPPPTPTNFNAVGGYGIVAFSADQPSYSQGGGHAYTQVYAAIVGAGQAEPVFADAHPFTTFTGAQGTAGAADATSYRFWAKWVSNDNVMSLDPAGPVHADTSINVGATLVALTGALTDTQLDQELSSSITGGNGNSVQNSEVAIDNSGWTLSVLNNDAAFTLGRNLAGAFIPGTGVAYIVEAAAYSAGRAGLYAEVVCPNSIPVVPGVRYQASAYTGSQRALTQLFVYWYDANGAVLSASAGTPVNAQNNDEKAGGTTLAGYKRVFLFDVAPANAVTAKVIMRKFATDNTVAGAVNSYLFFTMVMFTTARASQTVPDPYVPGPLSNVQTQAIVTNTTTVNGLNAQNTVKIDTNGYVTGYGLASTLTGAVPTSAFSVRADSFYIANPAGPAIAPSTPFIVRTTATTLNGQTIPVGVYMQQAYIQNGSIDSAKIGLAVITDAHIGSLNANKITAGQLAAQYIDSRGLTIKDAAGKVIFSSGATGVNFDTTSLRTRNYAPSIARPGWQYADAAGVAVGTRAAGLQYSHDGWYLYLPGTSGAYELWACPVQAFPAQNVVVSFSAYVNAAGTRGMNFDIVPGYNGGSVTVTQGVNRYSAVLPVTGASTAASQLRFIGLTSGIPLVIFDIQVEVVVSGNPTVWKPNPLDEITPDNYLSPANAGTFIAAATILGAHIAQATITNANIAQATITNANIAALAVDTLQLAGNAVTVPLSSNTPGGYYLSTASQVIAETGYGYFSIAGNVIVNFVGTFDGSVAVTMYAVCSDGATLAGTLFTDNGAGYSRTPAGVPAAYMFTLDRPGSWKFQLRAYTLSSQTNPGVATFFYGGTITAMGVKK